MLSYSILGSALGGSGALVGSDRLGTPAASVAYVLAAGLIVLTLFGERSARLPGVGKLLQKFVAAGRALPPLRRAMLLGAATPLLPCGLLWSAFLGAGIAGSALAGAEVMFGFALGAVPLLALAQGQARRLVARLSPARLLLAQRIAMLAAAGILIWRGLQADAGGCCT